MSERTFDGHDLCRVLDKPYNHALSPRWAERFGHPVVGSGGHYRYTWNELVIARALRDWPEDGPKRDGANRRVLEDLCLSGSWYVGMGRWIAWQDGRVSSVSHPGTPGWMLKSGPVHLIDVGLAEKELRTILERADHA